MMKQNIGEDAYLKATNLQLSLKQVTNTSIRNKKPTYTALQTEYIQGNLTSKNKSKPNIKK